LLDGLFWDHGGVDEDIQDLGLCTKNGTSLWVPFSMRTWSSSPAAFCCVQRKGLSPDVPTRGANVSKPQAFQGQN
jgi:hypothetical protein